MNGFEVSMDGEEAEEIATLANLFTALLRGCPAIRAWTWPSACDHAGFFLFG